MTGALLGVAMVCIVAGTGLVIATVLGIRTIAELAIVMYVIGSPRSSSSHYSCRRSTR